MFHTIKSAKYCLFLFFSVVTYKSLSDAEIKNIAMCFLPRLIMGLIGETNEDTIKTSSKNYLIPSKRKKAS